MCHNPLDNLGQAVIVGDTVQFTPAPVGDRDDTNARFTYTVTDGYDHEVTADISVSILRESVARPPYARDDSTSTFMNSAVTIDVLRNDGDSGGRATDARRGSRVVPAAAARS